MRLQIFGPTEDQALDSAGAASAVGVLTREINAYAAAHGGAPKSADEVAMGFLNVANEAMCRPIRALTQMKVCVLARVTLGQGNTPNLNQGQPDVIHTPRSSSVQLPT